MEAPARLRAARRIADLPAVASLRQGSRQCRRRIGRDIERAGFDRLIAPLDAMTPAAVDRVPAVLPVLAQQFPAEPFRGGPLAVAVEGDDFDARRLALGDRFFAGRRAQPDRQWSLPDRPGQALADRAAARLEHADPDRRRQRPGQIRQVGQVQLDGRLARGIRRGDVEILAVGGELLIDQAEMKAGLVRIGLLVQRDCRLRFEREAGARRAIIIARRDLDRERLARTHRPVRRRQFELELWRHKILDPEFDIADRRSLRVELHFGVPGADPRIARQPVGHLMRAERFAGQLTLFDLDPVRAQQP